MSLARRAVSLLAIVDDGVFDLAVDVLLSAIGGCDKAVKARQVQEQTRQANAAGPDFDTDHMKSNDEPVQERQSGTALKELSDMVDKYRGCHAKCARLEASFGEG